MFRGVLPGAATTAAEVLSKKKPAMKRPAAAELVAKRPAAAKQASKCPAAAKLTNRFGGLGFRVGGLRVLGFITV